MLDSIKLFFGGGVTKYRVKNDKIEMKGGGTGPFWGPVYFVENKDRKEAIYYAKKMGKIC